LACEDQGVTGWSSIDQVLSGRMIERLGDAVCGLHRAEGDEERWFLDLASKSRLTFSLSLASKLVAMVSPGLASKHVATVLVVWPQNHSLGFPG
jgi:hypothetical protein